MTDEPHGLDRGLTNYGDRDFARYLRRSFARSMGISVGLLNKPVVGIAMTPSGFNNCHRGMPELVEAVSRGVLAAGALPRPFPTVSLGEVFLNPTSMMYRNLMAMDTEEMIGAQPMDAVVLIGGCDKTVPAQLMGAASADLPAIQLVTGPMSTGRHRGQRLGACTDCRGFWAKYRAGTVDAEEIAEVEGRLSVTQGTCAVMGTASTMACIAEALGLSLPGTAAIPAVHSDRLVAAEETGRAAVRLIETKIRPSQVITEKSVENAIRVLMAVSGSTNAIVHLTAIAGRLGIRVSPERFNQISDETPVLVDLKPVGQGYMEDFHAAGGMGALLRELRPLLHLDTVDVEGRTLAERLDEPAGWVDRTVIRPFAEPVSAVGGLVALSGSLAPDGAIFKRAAATPALFESEGRAVVFTGLEDLSARIDDPDLDVEPGDILVLQNAGPHAAGMPEAGYLPIPKKLARAGVTDMVRISDARMSGTAFGSIVLHVAPEAAVGGPLAAVRDGDRIRLSIRDRRVDLLVGATRPSTAAPSRRPRTAATSTS
jgi:dihydroxy-acid dehydratase